MQVTASKSGHLLQCSWWLNPSLDLEKGEPGPAAMWGSAFHICMAWLLDPTKDNSLLPWKEIAFKWNVDEEELRSKVLQGEACLSEWLSGNNPWGIDFAHFSTRIIEKSYWLDPATGHGGPCYLDEETHTYTDTAGGPLPSHVIPGTLDLACIGWKGETEAGGLLLDHKTGARDYSYPATNPQLLTLGAMVGAKYLGVLHAPRNGLPVVYCDEVEDKSVYDDHLKALATAMSRIGDGSMRPGPYCRYCPAKNVCPAKQGELVSNAANLITGAGGAIQLVRKSDTALSSKKLGQLHQLISESEKIIALAKKELRGYVESNPAEVVIRPDGKVLQLIPRQVERLSKKSIIEGLGKVEGEKLLEELRAKGALSLVEEWQLRAEELE